MRVFSKVPEFGGNAVTPKIAKQFAYQGWKANPIISRVYRLERGFPFLRAGRPVVAIPQFKGVTLVSHTTTNVPKTFQSPATNTAIKWPLYSNL